MYETMDEPGDPWGKIRVTRRPLPETVRRAVCATILLAFGSVALAQDQAAEIRPEVIRSLYETQMADAEVIPKTVQDAFVAANDRYFYSGEFATSTITRDLAKRLIPPGLGIFSHRAREISTTLLIEQTLDRNEILGWYLHRIYLGRGCYGIRAASMAQFGKVPEALTLAQAAVLAALAVSPAAFDPIRQPDRALERRNFVLAEMVKAGLATDQAAETAMASPLDAIDPPGKCNG
jgi:membrane peptidoglycan carboxypeptidase